MLLKSKKRLTAYVLAALCVASTGFAATEHWNDASTMPKTTVATQAGDANWEQWKTSWEVTANCPNGLLFGTVCEPGMSVVVIASKTGSLSSYAVYSYDRMTAVAGFLAFFARAGTSKGISGLIQPVTKEGLRFERSPSFSPFFLLLSNSITGSVHELAVLRYGYDTGLAALVVGDSIGSVAADGRVRHVLDLCLRVQGLHDVCRDLLADFRRALQHEQAAPDTQTDDCQNPVLHNTNPFP